MIRYLICLCMAVSSLGVACFGNENGSLRKSPAAIREVLLSKTPIGSSINSTIAWLARDGHQKPLISKTSGFLKQEGSGNSVVGVQSVSISLGEYHSFPFGFTTSVEAYWGYDADGRLVDIWVWKTTDAP